MFSLKIKIAAALVSLILGGFGVLAIRFGMNILERLDRAEENVRVLQYAGRAAEKVLLEQSSLEKTVRSARNERNRELEEHGASANPGDTADLLRLLREDAAARRDRAAARAAGAMPGAGSQSPGS